MIKTSGNYPCGVDRKGVGRNSIYCENCEAWIYKKCSGNNLLTPGVH